MFTPPKPLTTEEIMVIIERKGSFQVLPQWRNNNLDSKCRKLCKDKLIREDRNWRKYGQFGTYYVKAGGLTDGQKV